MTETASPPAQPLEIRGRPRPVKRFSKRALMILLGTGSAIVLGSLAFALQGPKDDAAGPARELYNTGHNPEADGLAALPKSYGEIAPEDDVLGPPLPGDLGTPILKAQREGRMVLPAEDAPEGDPMREQLAALEAELREYLEAQIARIKMPKLFDFRPELPREANGKLYKRELRDEFEAKAQAS